MTMSMNTMDAACDNVKTQVKSFITTRVVSNNLDCVDIPGKYNCPHTLTRCLTEETPLRIRQQVIMEQFKPRHREELAPLPSFSNEQARQLIESR